MSHAYLLEDCFLITSVRPVINSGWLLVRDDVRAHGLLTLRLDQWRLHYDHEWNCDQSQSCSASTTPSTATPWFRRTATPASSPCCTAICLLLRRPGYSDGHNLVLNDHTNPLTPTAHWLHHHHFDNADFAPTEVRGGHTLIGFNHPILHCSYPRKGKEVANHLVSGQQANK